jgi:membrane associated rhomboid family serine protease
MLPIQVAVPTRYLPVVTWCLIALNSGVFLFQISLSPSELELFLQSYALIPARYFGPYSHPEPSVIEYLPFFTNMFLHGGFLRLILNMWTLWLFGPTVEDRLGRGKYLTFYIACGVCASLAHAVFNPTSTIPALGASGAISGVLGGFMLMFPFAQLLVVIPILFFPFFFELPAVVFAGLWFLMQVLSGTVQLFMPEETGSITWWAHIGGFVAGVVLTPVLRQSKERYRNYYADEGVLGFDPSGRRRIVQEGGHP